MMRLRKLLIILLSLWLIGCDPRYGFIESNFVLSGDSRLPKFVSIPNEINIKDTTTKIIFYTGIFPYDARVIVYTKSPEHKILYDEAGTFKWHPLTEKQLKNEFGYKIYPHYMIIKIDNIEEVFEARTEGNVLYVTDSVP